MKRLFLIMLSVMLLVVSLTCCTSNTPTNSSTQSTIPTLTPTQTPTTVPTSTQNPTRTPLEPLKHETPLIKELENNDRINEILKAIIDSYYGPWAIPDFNNVSSLTDYDLIICAINFLYWHDTSTDTFEATKIENTLRKYFNVNKVNHQSLDFLTYENDKYQVVPFWGSAGVDMYFRIGDAQMINGSIIIDLEILFTEGPEVDFDTVAENWKNRSDSSLVPTQVDRIELKENLQDECYYLVSKVQIK